MKEVWGGGQRTGDHLCIPGPQLCTLEASGWLTLFSARTEDNVGVKFGPYPIYMGI